MFSLQLLKCKINRVRFQFRNHFLRAAGARNLNHVLRKKLAAMFALLYETSQPNQPRGTNACTAGGPLDTTVCCWWRTQCSKKKKLKDKNSDQLKTLFVNQLIY